MTTTAIPERVKLAHIVASGLHQLAAAAADMAVRDRIAKDKTLEGGAVFDAMDALAVSLKAPYMAALAQLAGVDELTSYASNQNSGIASEAGGNDTNGQNTDLHGAVQLHSQPTRRRASSKRGGRK